MRHVFLGEDELDLEHRSLLEHDLSIFKNNLSQSKSTASFIIADRLAYGLGVYNPQQIVTIAYGPRERGLYFRTGGGRMFHVTLDHFEEGIPLIKDITHIVIQGLSEKNIILLPTLFYTLCQEYRREMEQTTLPL